MLISRTKEVIQLNQVLSSPSAEFIAIYGRRRVGKTYLISEFFKDKGLYFELTGSYKTSLSIQLQNFVEEFQDCFNKKVSENKPKNWQEAFSLLRKEIETYPTNKKVILFFDELPWLASKRSDFLSALEHIWNRYLSRKTNVIVIVCGSAASWMIKHVINNKGGLHGRLTLEINLKPFLLKEVAEYLAAKNVVLEKKQLIELYFAFGGIPKYLNYVERGKSIPQVIQETCFAPKGALTNEFSRLFQSLFSSHEKHIQIIRALAQTKKGLTQKQLQQKTELPSGGTFSNILKELEQSGFIVFIQSFAQKKRDGIYRLIDEYSLFYITWIEPALNQQFKDINPHHWQKTQLSPSYQAWAGCAFESLCMKHINNIAEALKISIVVNSVSSWQYRSDKETGAQIDLVIERTDKCMNLCEIKFSDTKFTIDPNYAEKLNYKKTCFAKHSKSKSSLFTTMISTYGVTENEYYFAAVDNQLTMDIFFE